MKLCEALWNTELFRKKKLNSIAQKYYKISAFLTTGVQTLQNSSHDRAGDRISDWSSSQAAVGVPLPHAAVSAFLAIDLTTKYHNLERITFKQISSYDLHYISSLNHFSNWSK